MGANLIPETEKHHMLLQSLKRYHTQLDQKLKLSHNSVFEQIWLDAQQPFYNNLDIVDEVTPTSDACSA